MALLGLLVLSTSSCATDFPRWGRAKKETEEFARLFMAPGMQHCNGGPGPNTFDTLAALDQWVANGIAPDKIIASHSTAGVVNFTRPFTSTVDGRVLPILPNTLRPGVRT